MTALKIALLQIAPCGTLEGNLEKGIVSCRKAKELGADIALFPEMWSNGYNIYGRPVEEWKAEAISVGSEFVSVFGKLAKELDMAIAVTFLEQYEGDPRNSMILFDRFGRRKITYAKVHTCDFDVERNLTPGEDFYVTTLGTAQGEVKVGAMICYDREFPESARLLMLKGAELILVSNACPMEIVLVIERLNREICRRTRVVGTFPDGNPALMLVCARLRHVAGTQWGNKKYMNRKHLEAALDDAFIAG